MSFLFSHLRPKSQFQNSPHSVAWDLLGLFPTPASSLWGGKRAPISRVHLSHIIRYPGRVSSPPIIRYTGAQDMTEVTEHACTQVPRCQLTIFSLHFWVPSLTISTKRDGNLKYIHQNICKSSLLLFILSIMSDSLQTHGLQHAICKILFHNIPELFTGLNRSRLELETALWYNLK